jgi:hypothetical protein
MHIELIKDGGMHNQFVEINRNIFYTKNDKENL